MQVVDKPYDWPLKAEPYEVQRLAFDHSRDRERYGYWLEMGLGKSMVLCADFMREVTLGRVAGLVILAPSYLKSTWRDEWAKWEMPFPLFTWPKVPKVGAREYREPHAIVYNYESMLHSGGQHLEALLKSGTPYMMAADESRAIARVGGKWNKKAMFLRSYAKQLRAMSGQPWTNSIMEMYPQLRWCGALNGWNPVAFRNHFAVMGGFKGREARGLRPECELEFQNIVASCGIRALKVDWTDLPPKIWPHPLEFEMQRLQQEMYDSMLMEYCTGLPIWDPEEGEEVIYAAHVGNMYNKLLQIARGFIIDNEGVARDLISSDKNPAINLTKEVIEATTGKIIVFAFHRHSVETLATALKGYGLVVLRGGMKDTEIEAVKLAFNTDDNVKVMLAQLTVGARGHTLLGTDTQRCSTTLYYECIFDADIMWQSADRNHRYGQTNSVVYHTISCSTIDDKIAEALQYKANMVESVFKALRILPERIIKDGKEISKRSTGNRREIARSVG